MQAIERFLTKEQEYSFAENCMALELQIRGQKAERQYKIGPYFADFYFPEQSLVLEVDGKHWHKELEDWKRDRKRDKYMNDKGYSVVRLAASIAMYNPGGALNAIRHIELPRTYFIESEKALKAIFKLKMEEVVL